jgi:hypothetical protein
VGDPRSAAERFAAKPRPDIAERVLGYTIAGVEGVYDRHHYGEEKADALIRLGSAGRAHRQPGCRQRRRYPIR